MSTSPVSVVFDCNVFVKGLIYVNGPGGECLRRALVKEVSRFIFSRGGNIEDSRTVNLRGQIAMMVLVCGSQVQVG